MAWGPELSSPQIQKHVLAYIDNKKLPQITICYKYKLKPVSKSAGRKVPAPKPLLEPPEHQIIVLKYVSNKPVQRKTDSYQNTILFLIL